MSKQEDFDKHSDNYVNERKSYGVCDPYILKEIGEANYQGCEYGYQYAVEKVKIVLKQMTKCDFFEDKELQEEIVDEFISRVTKAMQ